MTGQPRVIVATSGRREGEAKRVYLRLLAEKDGQIWTEVEIYEGIRCLGSRVLYSGSDAMGATVAGRVFNETVRALTADGVEGLEEIPAVYGYEIAEAAVLVQKSGQQPHLDADFKLGEDELEQFGLQIMREMQSGEDARL